MCPDPETGSDRSRSRCRWRWLACFIIAKVLEGLDKAHASGSTRAPLESVHGLLAAERLVVDTRREVKVSEFGIATRRPTTRARLDGRAQGQVRLHCSRAGRGLPLDRTDSDIFALGTMILRVLTSEALSRRNRFLDAGEESDNVDIRRRARSTEIPVEVERGGILNALREGTSTIATSGCREMLATSSQFLMSQDVVFTAEDACDLAQEGFLTEIDTGASSSSSKERRSRRDG